MGYNKIDHKTPAAQLKDKHLVINCRTGEAFAADTSAEAEALAHEHQKETENLLILEEEKARGNR